MFAGIVEGFDRSILLAEHDHRFPADIMGQEIARFLKVGGHAADMPSLGPDMRPFSVGPAFLMIAFARDTVTAHGRIIGGNRAAQERLDGHDTLSLFFS